MVGKKEDLIKTLQAVRKKTVAICSQLETEDFVVQPAPEVSPPKWHLGHTSWFFEQVTLSKYLKGYAKFNQDYATLFNSYYKAAGPHTIQANRGNLSRPTVAEVMQYRLHIDEALAALLAQDNLPETCLTLIETGIHHEQQHQELLYMDIKYILASNTLAISYVSTPLKAALAGRQSWVEFAEGVAEVGYSGESFSYDNERPRHKCYLYPFAISQSLVTNGDFLAFIEDGGYAQAKYWLSQGWDWVTQENIQHPLYWRYTDGQWSEYTLHGRTPLDLDKPLVHISYFEADAFAKWKGLRLPTEQEFEIFLMNAEPNTPNMLYHPNDAQATTGQVWCWTASQYSPYPRFRAFDGLLEEYNGKFMCNQFVLRGGCIATPPGHMRPSYRNFYLPHQRWMFSGIRLAKDKL